MGRSAGSKNRNYPALTLKDALRVSTAIQDQASGMTVSRLTLAELLDVSPSSSNFRDLVASSRLFGLTTGGINAEEFGLTSLGEGATGGDEVVRLASFKAAVLNVPPYKTFLESFASKKVPGAAAMREFLSKNAEVPVERSEECISFMLSDAETAGFLRLVKGAPYIDLEGAPKPSDPKPDNADSLQDEEESDLSTGPKELATKPESREQSRTQALEPDVTSKKVFIAHGKNRTPLDQLKKALDQFKVKYAVAVEEPNKGRPISRKVATLMREECSSGIFIFTADEHFQKLVNGNPEEVWRPSENVVFELGAASILYENRIVIFKEKGVSFPTDFSDLGYIEFEKDSLVAELGHLFGELVGLDILEVRAKG